MGSSDDLVARPLTGDFFMGQRVSLCLAVSVLFAVAVCFSLNGCGSGKASFSTIAPAKIQHIIVIFQENRTPDNLFQDPVLYMPPPQGHGADIAQSGLNSSGQTITLQPTPLGIDYDLSHAHSAFLDMYDGGKMDGANNVKITCSAGGTTCAPPNPQYLYVEPSDVGPYFQLAEQYTFGDRMFQTNEGPSFPAHQFIISGTSAPTATSNMFIADNAVGVANASDQTGCIAPPAEYVYTIAPNGNETTTMYPCADHPTLLDELDAKGVSWRYYTPSAGLLWTSPNAIQHICGPNVPPPNATDCQSADWTNNVILNDAQILTDISSGSLADVSWVIPNGTNSDHAGSTTTTLGPSWVASIVNAIGGSSYWANTAIVITWDDWGGWYDHVPPPKVINDGTSWGSGYVYGFRVPLIVVSPYAQKAYVSHVTHDFGSILNLIEETFGLPSLGYADAYADDLSDCFNFNQTPLVFQPINAKVGPEYFLHDYTPKTPPDND
jgi:phospholipase C